MLITSVYSCASLDKKDSSNEYFGKLLISQDNNDDKFSFNININLSKKDSIIQIKKPFYGNVLKIKVQEGKNLIFLPTKNSSPFYVPEDINRNFKYWLRQCLLSKSLNIYEVIEELDFSFKCKQIKDKTNFYIMYENVYMNGFVIRK